MIRRWLPAWLGLCLVLPVLGFAAGVKQELEGIKKKIEKEKRGITQVREREGSILAVLEQVERRLDKKQQELKNTNSKLDSILAELRKTRSELENVQASLDQRRELLKQRALALYRWHRSGSPFVVLNGGASLGALMRRKRYLELTLEFDRNLVRTLSEESQRRAALKETLAQKRGQVDDRRRELLELKESARKEAVKKREILASVRREKEERVRALKELEQAAHRLQKMIDEINRRARSKPQGSPPGVGFEAMRGKLDFPVRGEVAEGFGKSRHPEFSDELFRKGIDIEAPLGEPIRAVGKGKVVFADRFSGYGNMLIVDHGERYYTVYAHLSDLLKKSGDSVQRGEPIGLVGDSDSLTGTRLYFEIRKDGKPIDPLPWFRKR